MARGLLRVLHVGSGSRSSVLALAALAVGCATGAGIQTRSEQRVTVSDAGPGEPIDAAPSAHLAMPDAGRDAGAPDAPPDAGPIDARTCVAETCNGTDDDCDGVIDDGAACPCPIRVLAAGAYMFCAAGRPWSDARALCEGAGYHLVAIEDAVEDADLYAEIDALGWGDTWIGLGDAVAEGTWVWSTGDALAYEHWDEGEPNDGAGGEDCAVIMTSSGRESEWDDRGCPGSRPFVCEPD